jgi:hypothetical protein
MFSHLMAESIKIKNKKKIKRERAGPVQNTITLILEHKERRELV